MPTEIRRFDIATVGRMTAVFGAVVGFARGLLLAWDVLQGSWAAFSPWWTVAELLWMILSGTVSGAVVGVVFAVAYNVAAVRIGGVQLSLSR